MTTTMMMMQKYGVTLHDLTLTHLTWRPERLHQTTSSPWRHAHDLLTSHVTQHAHAHLNVFPVSRVFMNVERTALHAFSQRHMTSSGDSTVNCVILILHVKITHCSTNCVNDYINIVVNFSYFRLHRFILGLHHLISFTFFVSVDFCVKSYTFLIVLLHNTIIAYTRTIAVV